MPRFGWGLRRVRLDDGTLARELVPVALTPGVKRRHRSTGRQRERPKGAPGTRNGDGWRDYCDWHIARIVEGGMALGLGREVSIGMAAIDVRVSARTVERALRRVRVELASRPSFTSAEPMRMSPLFEKLPLETLDLPADPEEIWRLHRRYDESGS